MPVRVAPTRLPPAPNIVRRSKSLEEDVGPGARTSIAVSSLRALMLSMAKVNVMTSFWSLMSLRLLKCVAQSTRLWLRISRVSFIMIWQNR